MCGMNSRWRYGRVRYSVDEKQRIDDCYFKRCRLSDGRSQWRCVIDQVTPADYVARRRERRGWYHGARITRTPFGRAA